MEGASTRLLHGLYAWEKFQREYEQVLPAPTRQTAIERSSPFVKLLQDMFQIASQQTLPASGERVFQLLDSAHYNDQTEMLSITGMVCNKNDVSEIRRWFKNWAFRNLDWKAPRKIDVPTLSAKERLHLEKKLPPKTKTGRSLARALGYKIDDSDQKHLEKVMRAFARRQGRNQKIINDFMSNNALRDLIMDALLKQVYRTARKRY